MILQFDPTATTQHHCPACAGDNQCAVARGLPGDQCWCQGVRPAPGALAALTPDAAGRCLCRACLSGEEKPDVEG
ncbi:MAG: hypothetical protein CME40_12570 [Haliea sp.]|nr:hypothetical protein [Haliea sp.]